MEPAEHCNPFSQATVQVHQTSAILLAIKLSYAFIYWKHTHFCCISAVFLIHTLKTYTTASIRFASFPQTEQGWAFSQLSGGADWFCAVRKGYTSINCIHLGFSSEKLVFQEQQYLPMASLFFGWLDKLVNDPTSASGRNHLARWSKEMTDAVHAPHALGRSC